MSPRKSKLGQNFLIDDRARHAIAGALGDLSEATVLEIGPGHGAITEILAPRCRRLVLVELDPALAAELRFRFRAQPQVEIIEGDFLELNLSGLIDVGDPVDVIGNLPYYITSQILLKLFAASRTGIIARAVLMMQREVANRLTASPGVREYGLLSATSQLHARIDALFTLPPEAFSPPPDVFSTLLRLHFAPRFSELGLEPSSFDDFLHDIFAQKRKTLRNNLRSAGYASEIIFNAWPLNVATEARAETLTLEQTAALFRGLSQLLPGSGT